MATVETTEETVESIVSDWPSKRPGQQQHPKETALKMLEKYGPPDEATPSRLVWYDNGPWKRTEVHRESTPHRFPIPHGDHLYQFVDYRVPPEKFDELAAFDGSLLVRRTEGELGVTCHKEEANVLALNLAHDIVTDEISVEDAREAYARINAAMMAGGSPEYAESFQFSLPAGDQRDPDVTIVTDEVKRNRGTVALAGLALAGILYLAMRLRRRGESQPRTGELSAPERVEVSRP